MSHSSYTFLGRRRFLQALGGASAGAVLLPRRVAPDPLADTSLVDAGETIETFHVDVAGGSPIVVAFNVSLEVPTRILFMFEQPAGVHGLSLHCKPKSLLVTRIGEHNILAPPVDASFFSSDTLYCPVSLPIQHPLPFEFRPAPSSLRPVPSDEDGVVEYSPQAVLRLHKFVVHRSFGLGVVSRVLDERRVEVLFGADDFPRVLLHAGERTPDVPATVHARAPVVMSLFSYTIEPFSFAPPEETHEG